MLESLKKLKRVLLGKDFFYKATTNVPAKRFGSAYGGWWVATDGLKDKEIVIFSCGLGEDISFDLEMLRQYPCRIYGFDPTPKSIRHVESEELDERFMLCPYALGGKDGVLHFHLPKNEAHVSGSLENIASSGTIEVACKKLTTICQELGVKTIDILKMDIEGSEYKVIRDMIASSIFPRQILVEYHHFFDSFDNKDTMESIELLLSNGYELFYIDGYNYSFVRDNLNRSQS